MLSFGAVSSRQEIVERRKQKAAELQAAAAQKGAGVDLAIPDEPAPKTTEPEQIEQPPQVESSERAEGLEVPPGSQKRHRAGDGVVRTYVPRWGVLDSDHICYGVPEEAKDVAPDLCRGLMLPADRPLYSAATPTEACSELMSLQSLVSLLYLRLLTFISIVVCFPLCLTLFRLFFRLLLGPLLSPTRCRTWSPG